MCRRKFLKRSSICMISKTKLRINNNVAALSLRAANVKIFKPYLFLKYLGLENNLPIFGLKLKLEVMSK